MYMFGYTNIGFDHGVGYSLSAPVQYKSTQSTK
jgi:hypothetical protein